MSTPNDESLTPYLLVGPALLATFLFSWSIFHSDLSKREAREGIPIVNMMRGGNLWLPQINPQQLRTKPPLFYWSGLLSAKILGEVSEVSLRIPSVLAGVGTVFLTTFLGMRQFSPVIGCLSGLIITTCWRFTYLGSHARIDMLFTFFITLAFVTLWEFYRQQKLPLKWLSGIAIGLAVLTKGPLGWVFPLLSLFFLSRVYKPFPVPWLYILFLPLGMVGLWLMFGLMDGGDEFSKMIYQETIGRISASDAIHIHPKPFYHYIPQIFGGMAPWSLFLPCAIWQGVKNKEILFCLVAFATLFIFLSLFPGKRGDYLIPLYPMGSIILAVFFLKINPEKKSELSFPTWIILGMMMVSVLFLALSALLPEVDFNSFSAFLNSRDRWMAQLLYDKHRPATLFLILASAVMMLFLFALHKAMKEGSGIRASGVIAGWALILYLMLHGPVARMVNEYTSMRPFAEKVKQVSINRPVYEFGEIREDLYYYMDGKLQKIYMDPSELLQQPNALLIVRESYKPDWFDDLPGGKTILKMDAAFETYLLLEQTLPSPG